MRVSVSKRVGAIKTALQRARGVQWTRAAIDAATASRVGARCRRLWASQVARCQGVGLERGMSTAEYAVGTIAACAFAALLFRVVTSPEVQEMLTNLVNRALNTTG